MALDLVAVTFDATDPLGVAAFWGGLLGRRVLPGPDGALLPGDDTQVGLRFAMTDTPKAAPNPVHLHLASASLQDQRATVDRALRLGGRHVDVGQLPEEDHVVLADPGGNEFCVIEPGNNYLAGCGFLAEVSCQGTHDVGLFWRDALGWQLVWDRGEETAIQSPRGGTKLSWGGEPVAAQTERRRQRFELVTADLGAEGRRLVALGARRGGANRGGANPLGARADRIELTDPDGQEFSIRRG